MQTWVIVVDVAFRKTMVHGAPPEAAVDLMRTSDHVAPALISSDAALIGARVFVFAAASAQCFPLHYWTTF